MMFAFNCIVAVTFGCFCTALVLLLREIRLRRKYSRLREFILNLEKSQLKEAV
ncbi:MAG: hypothetical protein MJZ50_02635 [Treponema sp.]|nr:hypothetical protein [Treponema sp.]